MKATYWIIAIFLATASCGHANDRNKAVSLMPDPDLSAKRETYLALLAQVADEDGFIETDKCDSVVFSALTGAASREIEIDAAFDQEGKLHRRPLAYEECYPKASKSENSRDPFLMVLVYGMHYDRLDLLERVFDYGRRHGWVMGQGDLSRTYFTPNMQSLYAQGIQALGGPAQPERLFKVKFLRGALDEPPLGADPKGTTSELTGYEAHLQVVRILVYGMINGGIPDDALDILHSQAERQPHNALFASALARYTGADADVAHAKDLLKNEAWWPTDRLPTSADRCEPWITQRDESPDDWGPCPEEGRTHSGGDFLFAEAVLAGRL